MPKAPAHANIGPKMPAEDRTAMQARSDQSVAAASPETFRGGARWYPRANHEAHLVAQGVSPKAAMGSIPGQKRQREAFEDQHDVAQHSADARLQHGMGVHGAVKYGADAYDERLSRASAQIARLSPAMPAGMKWATSKGDPMNSQAAHEVNHVMSDHQFGLVENEERTYRNVATSKTKFGEASPQHIAAQADYIKVKSPINPGAPKGAQKSAARAALSGMAVAHASNGSLLEARAIGEGSQPRTTPKVKGEYGLGTVKIANFSKAVEQPDNPNVAAVDFKTGDILAGHRYTTDAPRGLGSQGTYDTHLDALKNTAKKFGITPSGAQAIGWVHDDTVSQAEAGPAQKAQGVGVARRGQAISHPMGPRSVGMPHGQTVGGPVAGNPSRGSFNPGAAMGDTHRAALAEPTNQLGPATKKAAGLNTAGRNRHGDDL